MNITIDKNYVQRYTNIFAAIQDGRDEKWFDEAALPSYTHSNPLMSRLFWNRIKTALAMAGDIQETSVLDFGCGGGVTFLYLHRCHCRITGCENQFSDLTEEVCRHLAIRASISKDVFTLNGTFDTIFALDVLEHVENLEQIITQLKVLLSPKGQLIVSGPTENALYRFGRKLAGFSGHYHVRNIYAIEQQLLGCGLCQHRIETLYWPFALFRISCWKK